MQISPGLPPGHDDTPALVLVAFSSVRLSLAMVRGAKICMLYRRECGNVDTQRCREPLGELNRERQIRF